MQAVQTLFAAFAIAAAGLVHAGEISEGPNPMSTQSRDAVRADTQAASHAGQLRYDFTGPAVTPMSVRSRDDVRKEAAWARAWKDQAATSTYVGGM